MDEQHLAKHAMEINYTLQNKKSYVTVQPEETDSDMILSYERKSSGSNDSLYPKFVNHQESLKNSL